MTTNSKARTDQSEPSFEGVYGTYCITLQDQHEVQLYRICLLICGPCFLVLGPWLLVLGLVLGLWSLVRGLWW